MCEDYRNAKLYEQVNLKEYSLEDPEGLAMASYFSMWQKDEIPTPCIYIGKDMPDSRTALRFYEEEVGEWLLNLEKGGENEEC